MARDVEIKARVGAPAQRLARVQASAEHRPVEIRQDDTFHPCASGRPKLRITSADEGIAIAQGLMRQLGIGDDQRVDRAYVDLLAQGAR